MTEIPPGSKKCPRCAETIKLEALVCHYCRQEFVIRRLGYCTTCHRQVALGDGTACPTCGNEVIDATVQSEPLAAPPVVGPPLAPQSFGAGPRPAAGASVAPTAMPTMPAPTVAGVFLAVLGGGVMMWASFLPWLKHHGVTLTGYEISRIQQHAGDNPLLIMNMFSRFSPFVTGMTTFMLGVGLATMALIILGSPKMPPPSRLYLPLWVHVASGLLLGIALLAVIANFSAVTNDNNALQLGYSVEYGMYLLAVGFILAGVGFTIALNRIAMNRPASSNLP